MTDLPLSTIMALCGFACGAVMGLAARGARFCTFGAVEDYVLGGKTARLRSWGLAVAVAMLLVSGLHGSGVARLDEAIYLSPSFGWPGAIVGGLLFGFGMSMVGTCGYGVLVRMAGGDLKAVVNFLVLGLSAYMTARGLTGLLRVNVLEPLNGDLSAIGGQGLPHLLAATFGMDVTGLWFPVGTALALALAYWCFKSPEFRASRRDIFAGILIGFVVAAGFVATGVLGGDEFEPQPVVSMTYVLPPGETIIYLLTFTGASLNFGIGTVLGTIAGAFAVAVYKGELHLESFDGRREMRRHLIGAFLMGFGGVTALGCTVGQGMTGMSTLSISAPIALGCILIGAIFGLYYLLTGSLSDAVRALLWREPVV